MPQKSGAADKVTVGIVVLLLSDLVFVGSDPALYHLAVGGYLIWILAKRSTPPPTSGSIALTAMIVLSLDHFLPEMEDWELPPALELLFLLRPGVRKQVSRWEVILGDVNEVLLNGFGWSHFWKQLSRRCTNVTPNNRSASRSDAVVLASI